MTNARNVQLHVSYNGMVNSECEVEIEKAFNTTVHLSFQVMLVAVNYFTSCSIPYRTHGTLQSPSR